MPDRPYLSDLSDAEWAVLGPLLPAPSRTGRPLKWLRRVMAEAIRHLVRSGCAWRMLPHPPGPCSRCQPARHGRCTAEGRDDTGRSPAAPRTRLGRRGLPDGAHTGPFAKWLVQERGWRVEVPFHRQRQAWRYGLEEKPRGFQVILRRWVAGRTFAWLGRSRRLARDHERLPETGPAMSRIMRRRIA